MNKSIAFIVLICCNILGNNKIKGQHNELFFEQITNESGRSLGFVTGIVQDEYGFMWFGTRNGLYRYNGYSYRLFNHTDSDSASLAFNDIAYLYYDNGRNFWMRHYDKLCSFANEKNNTRWPNISGKPFDIEVKIVQDKYNNRWIGPTSQGLLKHLPSGDSVYPFICPPVTYTTKGWNWIDSMLQTNNGVASIRQPGFNENRSENFEIESDGFFLICSGAEIDDYGRYDWGYVKKENEIIWEVNKENSVWWGGNENNRFRASVQFIKKGKYTLHYSSDDSHGCKKWERPGPDKCSFCGIQVTEIFGEEMDLLKNSLLKPQHESNFIKSPFIKDLLIDNMGEFWFIDNSGLNHYNNNKNSFEHYPIDFEKLLGYDITKSYAVLYQDKKGIFWIGTMHGLIRYDHLWGRFLVIQNKDNHEILSNNAVFSLLEDKKGMLWIGTGNGLNIYDAERNTIQIIKADNRNRLYDNEIIKIFEDRSGNIWVATSKGLNRLIKNPFNYIPLNIEADHSYPAIFDESKNLWLGIDKKLIKYSILYTTTEAFPLPDKLFERNEDGSVADFSINDLLFQPPSELWISGDNKVSVFNTSEKKIIKNIHFPAIKVNNDSIKNIPRMLLSGKGNKLYAISNIGIYQINKEKTKIEQTFLFPLNYQSIDEVELNYFKTSLVDSKGKLWIRTMDGIYVFNPQLQQLSLIFPFSDAVKYGPLADGNMATDNNGDIYLAAMPDIYKFNHQSYDTTHWYCPFNHDWGTANVKIEAETMWLCGSNGLYKLWMNNSHFDYYNIEHGLIDNSITQIESDKHGYLWLASLKGLSKFDTTEQSFQNYFHSSELVRHQFLTPHHSFQNYSSSKILFTTTGLLTFNPDSIDNAIPPVVIDNFTIKGKKFESDTLVYNLKNIVLKYHQNMLSFEFAVLDYSNPAQNKFKYMLEGRDDEWIETDANNRSARYSGLSPGRYVFKVQGANSNKVWNQDGARLVITITPPWYKTIVAYVLYIILIVGGVVLFVRVRERQLKEDKRILEEKVKERTAEIEEQKEELKARNELISEQHKNITDSIHYAQRIQAAILPKSDILNERLDDYFILYKPRDIVSGDYYWFSRIENKTVIVAADCTGHGVPGAFMSMLGVAFLNEIVNKEQILQPNLILNKLREQVIRSLHQTGEEGAAKDGMDVSLYVIDHQNHTLEFSGAYNPLYIVRKGEIFQLKADKMPIGYHIRKDVPFALEVFRLEKGDCLYNSSDGYPDQFNGETGKKFMTKQFKEVLCSIYAEPMQKQKEILETTFAKWKGKSEQIDDVIVIGVKV